MFVHDRYGLVLMIAAAGGALAAIASLFRPQILPIVRIFLRGMVAAVAVQVILGIVIFATGARPQQFIHAFYGAATLAALPLAMFIGKRLGGREEHVWLVGGAVLTLLFAFRAMATG
jgi:hypothetical protein